MFAFIFNSDYCYTKVRLGWQRQHRREKKLLFDKNRDSDSYSYTITIKGGSGDGDGEEMNTISNTREIL